MHAEKRIFLLGFVLIHSVFCMGAAPAASDPNLILWLRADAIPLANNGDRVLLWPDQSIYNHSAIGIPDRAPTFRVNAVNNRPGVRFSGANPSQYLDILLPKNANRTALTAYVVFKAAGSEDTLLHALDDPLGNRGYSLLQVRTNDAGTLKIRSLGSGAALESISPYDANQWAIATAAQDPVNSRLYLFRNGTNDGSVAMGPAAEAHGLWRIGDNGNFSSAFEGDIAEILVFDRFLNHSERKEIENYLHDKYAISIAFPDPVGGWNYIYRGDLAASAAAGALDGTWNHENGSDSWDGSSLGGPFGPGNAPGGASIITEPDAVFLRLQDPGDPRNYSNGAAAYGDPSNRKLYFGHDLILDVPNLATNTFMDDGVTLVFRIRIPSSGLIDSLHLGGETTPRPYPQQGEGHEIHNGGKGGIGIRQSNDRIISFSLDQPGMYVASHANIVPINPRNWHEYWVTIQRVSGAPGSHLVRVFVDRAPAYNFYVNPETGNDYEASYIAMGLGSTPDSAAMDVDYFGWKLGVHYPKGSEQFAPQIQNIVPTRGTTFHPAEEGLQFRAVTLPPNQITAENVQVILNGRDISSELSIGGTQTDRAVSYRDLQPDTAYSGTITVKDQVGRTGTHSIEFATFSEFNTIMIDVEDYNYDGGQYMDMPAPGSFQSKVGNRDVDYFDTRMSAAGQANPYRPQDGTVLVISQDVRRQMFSWNNALDYDLTEIASGEWLNYTRNFNSGLYKVFLRAQSHENQRVFLRHLAPGGNATDVGKFEVAGNSDRDHYSFPFLADASGNPIEVGLKEAVTFRLEFESAGMFVNYLLFLRVGDAPPEPLQLIHPRIEAGEFRFSFLAEAGRNYQIETATFIPGAWQLLSTMTGEGSVDFSFSMQGGLRFFRVLAE